MRIVKDLKRNIYIYIFLGVIFSIILFFSTFMYKNIRSVNKKNNYINSYFNIPEIYMMMSIWTIEDNPYVERFDKKYEDGGLYPFHCQLFDQADKKGIRNFSITRQGVYVDYCIEIQEVKGNKKFWQTEPGHPQIAEYPNMGIFINDLFGENIRFPVEKGRNFKTADFKEKDFLPIIAGHSYRKKFKIGDTLNIKVMKYYTENEEKIVQGKIIGFLEKDTEISNSVGVPEIINANNVLIIGLSNEFDYKAGFFGVFRETVNGVVETKNPDDVVKKIMALAREMGYEGKGDIVKLERMKDAYKDYVDFNDSSYSSYYNIFGISLFSSFVIAVLSIYLVIRKNKYDYGVLLINGAKKKDIRNNIILEMTIVLLISNIMAAILALKYLEVANPYILIGYDIIILVIVLISCSIILGSRKTIEFINQNEQNN